MSNKTSDARATNRRFGTPFSGKTLLITTAMVAGIAGGSYAIAATSSDAENPTFSETDVFFELNHTDGDLGIHVRIDGDGWRALAVDDPTGKRVLDVAVKGRLALQGLTELFSESAEPSFDELKPKEFFARFPEGKYAVAATTIEGESMRGSSMLSHVMPAPPGNVRVSGLPAAEDCDEGPVPTATKPVVITWDAVTASHPDLGKSGPVKVVKYEMVVEREEPTSLEMSMDLPPSTRSFRVPDGMIAMDSGDGFKYEIVVREASGNQTVFESCFKVKQ